MSHITTFTHHDSRGGGGAPASRRGLRHIGAVLAGSIVLAVLLLVVANLAFAQSAKKKNTPTSSPFWSRTSTPARPARSPIGSWTSREGCCSQPITRGSRGTVEEQRYEPGTRLVKDIDPGPLVIKKMEKTETGSSAPDSVLRTKKWIYFQATTVKYGEELWKSDGTEWGTKVVKDIVPGRAIRSRRHRLHSPENDVLQGVGQEARRGAVENRRDREGTKLIKDINPDLPPEPAATRASAVSPRAGAIPTP